MVTTTKVRRHKRRVKRSKKKASPIQPIKIVINTTKENVNRSGQRISRRMPQMGVSDKDIAEELSRDMSKPILNVPEPRFRPPPTPNRAPEQVWNALKGTWGAVAGVEGELHSGYKSSLESINAKARAKAEAKRKEAEKVKEKAEREAERREEIQREAEKRAYEEADRREQEERARKELVMSQK